MIGFGGWGVVRPCVYNTTLKVVVQALFEIF
nr:MAG TPA: Phosphoglucomutase/phosphomannomutase [Caudoviricetes sp.]